MKKVSMPTSSQTRTNNSNNRNVLFDNQQQQPMRTTKTSSKNRNTVGGRHSSKNNNINNNNNNSSNNNNTVSEAVSIQQSLLRTQKLVQDELNRLNTLQTTIDDDGKILQLTIDQQKNLNIKNAKKTLSKLQLYQQQEQRILYYSITFFTICCFYILWERIICKLPFIESIVSYITSLTFTGIQTILFKSSTSNTSTNNEL